MLLPALLITILSAFVFSCIRKMLKSGHDLHAFSFLILYVYTVFAQIGYAYFPELSIFIGAYFGEGLFYSYWGFMFLSFATTFWLFRIFHKKTRQGNVFFLIKKKNHGRFFFFFILFLLYIFITIYFKRNRDLFGYGGGTPMGSPLFGIIFWLYTLCCFIVFVLVRDLRNSKVFRIFYFLIFLISLELFLRVAIASGVRSTILYFFISLIFFEVYPLKESFKYQKKKLVFIVVFSVFLIGSLSILRTLRIQGKQIDYSSFTSYENKDSKFSNQELPALILLQDYYNPSHTLFISMHYSIIDPLEVLKSNVANSLVRMNYPFLSNTIVKRVKSIEDDRGAGWAYHYFVEGYNAFGLFGIFYNAIFWNFGFMLWTRLARSNDEIHNKSILAICSLIIALVMRSQTSAFIQFYWLLLLPSTILLILANNLAVTFKNKDKWQ